MKYIGSYDAKTKLPEILRSVSAGESFTITKHGKPIADLVPSLQRRQALAIIAIENILKLQKSKLSDNDLKKYRTSGRK